MVEQAKGRTAEKVVLVWVTNPYASENIAKAGRRLADENGLELMIISIQDRIRNDWETKVNDLEQLHNSSRQVGAELTVIYADNKIEAAAKTILDVKPKLMVTGIPGDVSRSAFLEQIRNIDPSIPVYTVDLNGNAVKIAGMQQAAL